MTTPVTCESLGHPGSAYNPIQGRTWCACGTVTYDGDQGGHITCCGGPLDRRAGMPPYQWSRQQAGGAS